MDVRVVRYAFVLLVLSFAVLDCGAQDLNFNDTFSRGNEFYAKGEYDSAIKEYEKLMNKGFESGNLYYNTGNCYFKKGDLGRAILNYERARRLIPGDSDLESNYQYALSKASESAVRINPKWFPRMLENMFGRFTVDKLTVLLSSIYLSAVFVIIISIYTPLIRRYALVIVLSVLVVLATGAIELKDKISGIGTEAIVVDESLSVRFEPFERATTFFQLSGGDKVRILDSQGGWVKIKRADGRIGWVKSAGVEVI